jgi:hypothetical protein
MVCLTSRILSGSRKRSSGFHDGSDISLTLQLPGSEGSSSKYSFFVRLLLIIVKAGLIAILVTQVRTLIFRQRSQYAKSLSSMNPEQYPQRHLCCG